MSIKLDQKQYWFAQYGWTGGETDEQILNALNNVKARTYGVNVWWYWVHGPKAHDAEHIKRVLELTAEHKVYFWLTLTGSGWALYNHSIALLEEVLADEQVRKYFLGLYTSEPPPPSLRHGFEVPGQWVWFDRQHIRIPTALYETGRTIEEQMFATAGSEFTTAGGAATHPASPAPLTPSGLRTVGASA